MIGGGSRQAAPARPGWRDVWGIRPRPFDVAIAVVVAVGVTVAINVAELRFPESRPPDARAYIIGVTFGALVLLWRRWPVGVLIASALLLQVYYWSDYPTIWPAVPLAAALYTATAAGHLRWSLAVAAWYWALPLVFALTIPYRPLDLTLSDLVRDGSLMVAVLLAGDAARSHGALMAVSAERLRRAEADRLRETQELSAARVIQQQLLPKEMPALPGWRVAADYQPAQAIGGDFYAFLPLPDGRLAIFAGDVTDKGIPAALVMASAHGIVQNEAAAPGDPGEVLARANERLFTLIPAHMFVTCLYLVLDPATGHVRVANAGHNPPLVISASGVQEIRATGMPLGALPNRTYEELAFDLAPGDSLLLYSDGMVEAHDATGAMFGFDRVRAVLARNTDPAAIIAECRAALRAFVGAKWEQEDDLTFVTVHRAGVPWRTLGEFSLPSRPGNEKEAMRRVADIIGAVALSPRRREQLQTAVAEATMNAIEHGNHQDPNRPVRIEVAVAPAALAVRITDSGGGVIPADPVIPDLAAKLAGTQSPRGWGLFLIEQMVDAMRVTSDGSHTTVELTMRLPDPDAQHEP